MAAVISNTEESKNSETSNQQRKKRRKFSSDDITAPEGHPLCTNSQTRRWKTEVEQQIYSSKLVQALRRVGQGSLTPVRTSIAGRQVRETADRVLAVAAKGRTRWSRAILTRRLNLKLKKQKRSKQLTSSTWSKRPRIRYEKRRLPAVQRKVRVLSRLVPGSRKLPLPNLLEEATDYIAALEMQIRAMTALAELLAGAPANQLGSRSNSSSC